MEDSKERKRSNTFVTILAALILFIIVGMVGGVFSAYWLIKSPSFLPPSPISIQTTTQNSQGKTIPVSGSINLQNGDLIADVAEKVSDAVVRIDIYKRSVYQGTVSTGFGSGFIVREDGFILTNNHVVEGANSIKVTLRNGKTLSGSVVGTDSVSDIAVIKIKETGLPTLTLSDSDKVRVGQIAIAIGNPLGYDYTVTVGVVSGIQREITPPQQEQQIPQFPFFPFFPFDNGQQTQQQPSIPMVGIIQTDAPINPGNSGGPLVNLKGEVIGINFLIESNAQGLGFAVSSNTAKKVMNDLIEYGTVSWPSLGVVITENSDANAKELGLKTNKGVIVVEVPEGPAREAGIKKNDVIVAIDGREVVKSSELIAYIRSKKVGDTVKLEINRGGKKLDISVKLGELKR